MLCMYRRSDGRVFFLLREDAEHHYGISSSIYRNIRALLIDKDTTVERDMGEVYSCPTLCLIS